jgi:hypothetical protein
LKERVEQQQTRFVAFMLFTSMVSGDF